MKSLLATIPFASALAVASAAHAQTAITPDTAPPPLQNVQTIAIDASAAAQLNPHIDGSLVAYSANANDGTGVRARYFRIGVDAAPREIGRAAGEQDLFANPSGSRIVYSHQSANTVSIMLFDTSAPISATNPVEIASGSTNGDFTPAIQGDAVAYIDADLDPRGELVVYDDVSKTSTRLTNDTASDLYPSISADGKLIVWQHCVVDTNSCDIWQAVRTGVTWTVSVADTDPVGAFGPGTNSDLIVYTSYRPDINSASHIFIRHVGGSVEETLSLPGAQAAAAIAGDFITFEGQAGGDKYDVFLYQLSTNRLWNLTNTPTNDEAVPDITVLPSGEVRVVYFACDTTCAAPTVHVVTVTVPPAGDSVPPTISIVAPADGAIYTLGSTVLAQYSCSDSGSGVATCQGPVANGAAISTSAVGVHAFAVNAADNAGNNATQTVTYSVGYKVCVGYDPSKAKKAGSTYPIQIQLCDANGVNVSSSSTVVHAVGVTQVSTNAPGTLDDAGNSNPDFDFRYDAASGSYIFNLKTTGFATGTYALGFTATGDPTVHTALFQIK